MSHLLDKPLHIPQTDPPHPARETLPTMYDLPSEDPEEPGLPDDFHYFQPQLLRETFAPPVWSADQVYVATDLNLYSVLRRAASPAPQAPRLVRGFGDIQVVRRPGFAVELRGVAGRRQPLHRGRTAFSRHRTGRFGARGARYRSTSGQVGSVRTDFANTVLRGIQPLRQSVAGFRSGGEPLPGTSPYGRKDLAVRTRARLGRVVGCLPRTEIPVRDAIGPNAWWLSCKS